MPRPVHGSFLRLDGRIGWQQSTLSEGITYDAALDGLRLGDGGAEAIPATEPGGTFGGRTRPTGLAVGRDGRLFLADPHRHRILTYIPHKESHDRRVSDRPPDDVFVPLWRNLPGDPGDPYDLLGPRGVVVGPGGDLVVADSGHSRIVVYGWPHLSPRRIVELGPGTPIDLAFDDGGLLYVADPVAKRVRRFDHLLRPDGSYRGGFGALQHPEHLAIDSEGRLLVLDTAHDAIIELDAHGLPIAAEGRKLDEMEERPYPPLDPPLRERVFPSPLRLDSEGLQLPQSGSPDCPALPLPSIEVDRQGRWKGRDLRLLAQPVRVTYPAVGRYLSEALDSGLIHCVWHRLVLDADLPHPARIAVRTFTAAAELEPARIAALGTEQWSKPLTIGPSDEHEEVLIQSPPGRYLWLELELTGDGETTPLVRNLTLYAPRQSSLGYLPPVFHEDEVGAHFLDRFLSYFDTVYSEIETAIEGFARHLDPDGAPPGEFLAWLASWLDITFLAQWSDATRRTFIREAIDLYKRRGTVAGLQRVLQLHAGRSTTPPGISVVEHFRLAGSSAGGWAKPLHLAGRPATPAPDEIAHHFTVVLPEHVAPDDASRDTLERLIEEGKPAHTRHRLRLFQPGICIGHQSTVGVDTLLGGYRDASLGGTLAPSTRLEGEPPSLGQLPLGTGG